MAKEQEDALFYNFLEANPSAMALYTMVLQQEGSMSNNELPSKSPRKINNRIPPGNIGKSPAKQTNSVSNYGGSVGRSPGKQWNTVSNIPTVGKSPAKPSISTIPAVGRSPAKQWNGVTSYNQSVGKSPSKQPNMIGKSPKKSMSVTNVLGKSPAKQVPLPIGKSPKKAPSLSVLPPNSTRRQVGRLDSALEIKSRENLSDNQDLIRAFSLAQLGVRPLSDVSNLSGNINPLGVKASVNVNDGGTNVGTSTVYDIRGQSNDPRKQNSGGVKSKTKEGEKKKGRGKKSKGTDKKKRKTKKRKQKRR